MSKVSIELNTRANAPSPLLPRSSMQKRGAYFRELTVHSPLGYYSNQLLICILIWYLIWYNLTGKWSLLATLYGSYSPEINNWSCREPVSKSNFYFTIAISDCIFSKPYASFKILSNTCYICQLKHKDANEYWSVMCIPNCKLISWVTGIIDIQGRSS